MSRSTDNSATDPLGSPAGVPADQIHDNDQSGGGPGPGLEPIPANSTHLLKDPNLQEILLSDVGVESLLSRLKQSIFSCKEFSLYIKKLATVEAEHSSQLKKAARTMTDSFKRPEIKKGTFQTEVLDIIKATDRVGDAGNSYIDSMHRIHDELNELVKAIDRQRKTVKETAMRHEKSLVDAEQLAEKAKTKYDATAEELDKARGGDPGKKLAFNKKSEDELHRRMTVAEVDYQQKVETAQRLRRETTQKLRVDSVQRLQSLILECDEALNLQVMRYANLSETLQLNRGFVVAPIRPKNSPTANLSVKEMASKIDSQLDFYNFVLGIPRQKKTLNRPDLTFRKHSSLGPAKPSAFQNANQFTGNTGQGGGQGFSGGAMGGTMGGSGFQSFNGPTNGASAGPMPTRDRQASTSSTAASVVSPLRSTVVGSGTAKTGPVLGPISGATMGAAAGAGAGAAAGVAAGASSLGPGPGPAGPRAPPDTGFGDHAGGPGPGTAGGASSDMFNPQQHGLPVFGTDLEELLDYEEGTVPRIVYQCIQAIDNFGLEVEGIYKTNGNAQQIQEIKRQFNIDAAAVDLLRPSEEVNDIHSVASALKLYFKELPDPLLTKEFHRELINAANVDDEIRRRDTIHSIINKLPDPNYTTLRYLIFHLFRVQEREATNRMGVTNLGIVWGPTLMATDYSNVGEMATQGRVVETVLLNAYAIFEAE